MRVIERLRQRINQMLSPDVVDYDERREFEERERQVRARMEALRLEAYEVIGGRHVRRNADRAHQ